MKVILQQDIKSVGKKGDIVEVSEGYGRNFLLPKKFAIEATAVNLNVAKAKAGSAARKKAQDTDEAKLMASQLSKMRCTSTASSSAHSSGNGASSAPCKATDPVEHASNSGTKNGSSSAADAVYRNGTRRILV